MDLVKSLYEGVELSSPLYEARNYARLILSHIDRHDQNLYSDQTYWDNLWSDTDFNRLFPYIVTITLSEEKITREQASSIFMHSLTSWIKLDWRKTTKGENDLIAGKNAYFHQDGVVTPYHHMKISKYTKENMRKDDPLFFANLGFIIMLGFYVDQNYCEEAILKYAYKYFQIQGKSSMFKDFLFYLVEVKSSTRNWIYNLLKINNIENIDWDTQVAKVIINLPDNRPKKDSPMFKFPIEFSFDLQSMYSANVCKIFYDHILEILQYDQEYRQIHGAGNSLFRRSVRKMVLLNILKRMENFYYLTSQDNSQDLVLVRNIQSYLQSR